MHAAMRTVILTVFLAGAGWAGAAMHTLRLSSPAFGEGDGIPSVYTCDGRDVPPPLEWHGVDAAARSLVLIVDDPDAPDPRAPKTTWVHWVVYNLPPADGGLGTGTLPAGAENGLNSWKREGYGGPCPPIGRHRYFFKLYALDTRLSFAHPPRKDEVERAMRGHVLQRAELIGTYRRR